MFASNIGTGHERRLHRIHCGIGRSGVVVQAGLGRSPCFRPRAGAAPGDRRISGVWPTQGSGKSLSMVFDAKKVIREPAMENPHRGANRSQRPGRSTVRHLFQVLGPAAAAADPGGEPPALTGPSPGGKGRYTNIAWVVADREISRHSGHTVLRYPSSLHSFLV